MLVVLASLLIPVSVISVWAIRTVTNTDQYVATMAPLARNQVIVDHLASKATDELFSTHIVQNKVTAALPAKAKPIVTPIVNQVHNYVYGLALQVFQSPKFGQLWDTLNRHTHDAVVDVLTGKQSPLTKKLEKGGGIVVNVTPALNNLIDKANARGVTLFNPLKAILSKGDSLGVTVVSKSQVSKFTGAVQPHRHPEVGHPGRRPGPRGSRHPHRAGPPQDPAASGGRGGTGDLVVAGRPLPGSDHLHQPGRAHLQPGRCRLGLGHHAPIPQDRPALDAARVDPVRPRCLAGRSGPLRRLDPLDLRQGCSLGGGPGPRGDGGRRARRRRLRAGHAAPGAGSSST